MRKCQLLLSMLLVVSCGSDPEPEVSKPTVVTDTGAPNPPDVGETDTNADIAEPKPEVQTVECGDHICSEGETKFSCPEDCDLSCNGKCGEFNIDWPCQCDTECAGYEECCADYQELCDLDPVCGNSVCEVTENTENCAEDCPPECGNGDCEASENADNCPSDCGDSCESKCFVAFDAQAPCQCDPACLANDNCCEDYTVHCVICGNGDCETGETQQNCPEDCGFPPNPISICMETFCGDELQTCENDAECASILNCILGCEADLSCIVSCPIGASSPATALADALIACSVEASCPGEKADCGNGDCEEGEDPVNCPADCAAPGPSCVGHCGDEAPGGCFCDEDCKAFGDCCVDFEAVCLGGSCGNLKCESWESTESCIADCAGGPLGCVVTKCEVGTCGQVPQCKEVLGCIAGCPNSTCTEECMAEAPAPAKALLSEVATCALTNTCSQAK